MSKYWLNIFDSCEVTEVHPIEYYTIKYNKETNSCEIFDVTNNLFPNGKSIVDKYNIFEGKNIIVDRDSFIHNGVTKIIDIVNLITLQYKISWVKKILIKKDLSSRQLEKFIESCRCEIVDFQYIENTCNMVVRDNLGITHYLSVLFHERPWCKTEPYYSNFIIAKPNFVYV